MSLIPGERDLTRDEVQRMRDMRAAGETVQAIAAQFSEDENRVASILSPKRTPPAKREWKRR